MTRADASTLIGSPSGSPPSELASAAPSSVLNDIHQLSQQMDRRTGSGQARRDIAGRRLQAEDAQQRPWRARRLPQPGDQRPPAADCRSDVSNATSCRAARPHTARWPSCWSAAACGSPEALGLIWDDIDPTSGTITVNRQANGTRGQTGPTKSRRPRSVEAGPDLIRTLTDYKARQGEHHRTQRRPVFTMPVRRTKASQGRWLSASSYPCSRRSLAIPRLRSGLPVVAVVAADALNRPGTASLLLVAIDRRRREPQRTACATTEGTSDVMR